MSQKFPQLRVLFHLFIFTFPGNQLSDVPVHMMTARGPYNKKMFRAWPRQVRGSSPSGRQLWLPIAPPLTWHLWRDFCDFSGLLNAVLYKIVIL
ncbi:hypothetical protein CDAR_183311 [Caerostris darwini]|uniref:Uncharacterized protein n=1 Tax=Caerostris darwini TaxID=1538125 RepID=A0AAV4WP46_9ARAC|nr:hypothetical protein CDAR_183311 [Caerostris darwini]